MAKTSFHQLDDELRLLMLQTRKHYGKFTRRLGGFSGDIYVFEDGNAFPSSTCAKVPKVSTSVDTEEAARRFLREMKIQRELYYNFFVHWPYEFDFVLDAPIAWFRLWHCDLSQLIEDGSFTVSGRLSMLAYIVAGMMHCHRRGLLAHQDFKPENIFVRDLRADVSGVPEVDVFRVPKIADFGSANLAAEVGEFRGTRAYMAPEQWEKQPLGQHTTVWSIGVMTYELLSHGMHPVGEQTRPWRNRESEIFKQWQNDKMWKRWKDAGMMPLVPLPDAEMNKFVRSCLSPDPNARPSLNEVLAVLLNRLREESEEAHIQAEFQIAHAEDEAKTDHNWPYLDARYNELESAVSRHFGWESS